MFYPICSCSIAPVQKYAVNGSRFRERCWYDGVYWGIHLGEDIRKRAGTSVVAIGNGRVVYSAFHPGTPLHPNWGNIVIIGHRHPKTKQNFFSVYGHLAKRLVRKGTLVEGGRVIGKIAKANTAENGWWPDAHLHFAVFVGLWKGAVLPGYWKRGQRRTLPAWWKKPSTFLRAFL